MTRHEKSILELTMTNPRSRLIQSVVFGTIFAFLSAGSSIVAQDSPQNSPEIVYEKYAKGVTPPKPVYQPNPDYAESARKKKIQGEVLLSMIVTAEGTVRDATVTQSLDKDLDKKALEAVAKWKFQPATKDGKPVAIYIAASVQFHMY